MNTYHFDRETDTLTPQVTVNMPIYDSKEQALADIDNLSDGQVIATREMDEYYAGSLAPVGSALIFEGNEVPYGWLWEDGSPLSKTEWADLYSVVGDKFGSTDTTFNLPTREGYIIKAKKGTLATI